MGDFVDEGGSEGAVFKVLLDAERGEEDEVLVEIGEFHRAAFPAGGRGAA